MKSIIRSLGMVIWFIVPFILAYCTVDSVLGDAVSVVWGISLLLGFIFLIVYFMVETIVIVVISTIVSSIYISYISWRSEFRYIRNMQAAMQSWERIKSINVEGEFTVGARPEEQEPDAITCVADVEPEFVHGLDDVTNPETFVPKEGSLPLVDEGVMEITVTYNSPSDIIATYLTLKYGIQVATLTVTERRSLMAKTATKKKLEMLQHLLSISVAELRVTTSQFNRIVSDLKDTLGIRAKE